MSFVSYAQNYEDVMLWRALKHVENGFYIDVGANDPHIDSVTKAFYDRGWHGINVEPLRQHHHDLMIARPNDINLLCAAGSENGQIELWECDVRGWATASTEVVNDHKRDGHDGIFHRVPTTPLRDICAQYVVGDIHFLKVDVEGFEKQVIQGMDFGKYRPWILVVEATKPNSTDEIHEEWEPLILSNDYILAYADGLNRFYVSQEKAANLLQVLQYPPNVFDGYIRVQQHDSELRAQQALEDSLAIKAQADQVNQQLAQAHAQHQQTKEQLQQALSLAQTAQTQADQLHQQLAQTHTQEQQLQQQLKEQASQAQSQVLQLQQAQQMVRRALEQAQHALARAEKAESLAEERMAQINALFSSASWLITAPLRWLAKPILGHSTAKLVSPSQPQGETNLITSNDGIEKFHVHPQQLDKNNSMKGLPDIAIKIWLSLENNPKIRENLLRLLRTSPALDHKIRRMYEQNILKKQQPVSDWRPVEQRDHTASAASTKIREINLLATNFNAPLLPLNSLEPLSNGINSGQRSPLETHNLDYRVNR